MDERLKRHGRTHLRRVPKDAPDLEYCLQRTVLWSRVQINTVQAQAGQQFGEPVIGAKRIHLFQPGVDDEKAA